MSQVPKGNVVALGDHPRAKGRMSRQQSAQMIADCRTLAIDRMSRALAGMLDRIEDDLFELAEKSGDRESQNAYLDARAQAREKRTLIQDTFRRHFVDFFDSKVSGKGIPASLRADGEMQLLDDDALAGSIAVDEMSRKLRESCEGELFALSQRLGFLLDKPELADEANPLSPATVCAALKDACDQLEATFKVRMTLLHQLERYVAADLQGMYHELNAHLVARSVLPDVRPRVPRAAAPVARARAPVERKGGAIPSAVSAGAPSARQADVLATLADLLSTSSPGGPPTVPASFMSELTRMHRESPAGPDEVENALVNVVRRIRAAPNAASLGTVDSITIDLVAMLFDFIFDDDHIPPAAKAHLGRLQIPTLKVALLDKSFFSSKSHPARRLLDLLAESAIGLDEAGPREGEVLQLIERVVQRVLDEFVADQGVFEKLAGEVAAFIEERQRAEAALVERSARLIEERERDEDARLAAHDAIQRRLAAREWVPPVVRSMLQETWTRALVRVHRAEGENSAMWQGLLGTVDELLWSVEPKNAPDERKRLVTILPGMLKRLQLGMDRGEMSQDDRTVFLGSLVDCHAAAMKAGARGMAVVPPSPAPVAVSAAPSIERSTVPLGETHVEEIRLRTPDSLARSVFTRTGIWTHLQRGTWVEFAATDGTRTRGRLTWISPNKGVYLFTNPFSSAPAISVSPEALAEEMRRGEARVIDDAPLTERAVDSMLATLKESQG
ncbi:MAG TPA: DUF1631 domain-containing protein [Usitatibacter sp.]|nr:DUF1631 domain-containing protein [Usitatibacter sp.]